MFGFNSRILFRSSDYCMFSFTKIDDYRSTLDNEILNDVDEFIGVYDIRNWRTDIIVYLIGDAVYDRLFNVCEVPPCVSTFLDHFVGEL